MSNLDPLTDAKLVRGLIDLIYPVGSDVFNESADFNPNKLYPNTTWEQIRGVMPIGVDERDTDFNTAGKTGGSKEMQRHSHEASSGPAKVAADIMRACAGSYNGAGILHNNHMASAPNVLSAASDLPTGSSFPGSNHDHTIYIDDAGTGNAGNMPPYRTTYWWHRIK